MIDISGQKFGFLLSVERAGIDKGGNVLWRCICDCGRETNVLANNLKRGTTKSCGSRIHPRKPRQQRVFDETSITKDFEEIFDGLMLGDGSLRKSPRSRNACFTYRGKHRSVALKYKIVFEANGFTFPPSNPRHILTERCDGWEIGSRIHGFFTKQYNRWYPQGKKIIPKDLIISPLTVKHWYYGDGGLAYHHHLTRRVKFATNGFAINEAKWLAEKVNLVLGICSQIGLNNEQPILLVYKKDFDNLFSYIGPCDIPCYQYKWIVDDRPLYNYYKNNCPCVEITN